MVMSSDTVFWHFGTELALCALHLLRPCGLVLLVAPEDRRAGVSDFLHCLGSEGYQAHERRVLREGEAFHVYLATKRGRRKASGLRRGPGAAPRAGGPAAHLCGAAQRVEHGGQEPHGVLPGHGKAHGAGRSGHREGCEV